jgi:hypothetical protein
MQCNDAVAVPCAARFNKGLRLEFEDSDPTVEHSKTTTRVDVN